MASGPRAEFKNPVINWIDKRLPVFTIMNKEYGTFPTPKNFNYFWSFGGIAMTMLIIMILTGIFLAMNYAPNSHLAFGSVEHIMRDVNYGWLLRYLHMNGASFFFLAVYVHMFRGMYYGSFKKPRELLWIFGVLIYLLMMATAFMGYTLPWSQMGGWAATVITNLFSAIPGVGEMIVSLLWGGFSVDNPTLNRFFALHYLLPFVIFGVVFLHVWALHITGSNNPLGIDVKGPQDTVSFHPFYTAKDAFGLCAFLVIYAAVSFFYPNVLAHPDHYIEFDPMKTPAHIVPEWYFLPFYAILRSITFGINPYIGLSLVLGIAAILPLYCARTREMTFATAQNSCDFGRAMIRKFHMPIMLGAVLFFALGYLSQYELSTGGHVLNLPFATFAPVNAKFGGVLAMFGAVAILFVLPWLDTHPVRSAMFRPKYRVALWLLVVDFIILGWLGSQVPTNTLTIIGQIGTAYYFGYFLVLMPWLSRNEKALPLPNSINEAVLQDHSARRLPV
jgi:ubiquinol-cytochrome c reductase cytochrome b subunit